MACKILNLIACIIYLIALFFILFSFEPKKMGGVYKLKKRSDMDWSSGGYNYPGEVLVHPFYISWTGVFTDAPAQPLTQPTDPWTNAFSTDTVREPDDWECIYRFGPTDPLNQDNLLAEGNMSDGLLDYDSELPCIVSIVNATTRSQFAQRRYANYVFGAAWEYDANDDKGQYRSYGPRAYHKEDYGLTKRVSEHGVADNDQNLPWQYDQLTPNTWATQDSIFGLCQVSGFFLAIGITCHILAFLMGGFIWNYAKCCCDFGICAFVFNSIVWASVSLVCYIISICAFAGIFFQGREQDVDAIGADNHNGWGYDDNGTWVPFYVEEDKRLEVVWSIGGALIITGMVFTAIAISLASYQWAQDKMKSDDDKMEAAVEEAVRRVSNVNM